MIALLLLASYRRTDLCRVQGLNGELVHKPLCLLGKIHAVRE